MATKDNNLTSHDVKNQPRVLVEEDSIPAFAVDPKFIKVVKKNKISGFSGVSIGDGGEEDEFSDDEGDNLQESLIPAPEYTDILIKNNGDYENIQNGGQYGTLYQSAGRSRVELEFKVIIPDGLAGVVTGIEILQDDEVIASI